MRETSMPWEPIKTERREVLRGTALHRQEILLHRQRHLRLLLDGLVQSAGMNTTLESSAPSAVPQRKRSGFALSADMPEISESSVPNADIKKNRVYQCPAEVILPGIFRKTNAVSKILNEIHNAPRVIPV